MSEHAGPKGIRSMADDDGKMGDVVQNAPYDEVEDVEGESSMSMTDDSFRSPAKGGRGKPAMAAHNEKEEEFDDEEARRKQDGALMNLHHDEEHVLTSDESFDMPTPRAVSSEDTLDLRFKIRCTGWPARAKRGKRLLARRRGGAFFGPRRTANKKKDWGRHKRAVSLWCACVATRALET